MPPPDVYLLLMPKMVEIFKFAIFGNQIDLEFLN
jgi:hypothetical protein